jgi:hypothetical protein
MDCPKCNTTMEESEYSDTYSYDCPKCGFVKIVDKDKKKEGK